MAIASWLRTCNHTEWKEKTIILVTLTSVAAMTVIACLYRETEGERILRIMPKSEILGPLQSLLNPSKPLDVPPSIKDFVSQPRCEQNGLIPMICVGCLSLFGPIAMLIVEPYDPTQNISPFYYPVIALAIVCSIISVGVKLSADRQVDLSRKAENLRLASFQHTLNDGAERALNDFYATYPLGGRDAYQTQLLYSLGLLFEEKLQPSRSLVKGSERLSRAQTPTARKPIHISEVGMKR